MMIVCDSANAASDEHFAAIHYMNKLTENCTLITYNRMV